MTRFPLLPPDELNDAQRRVHQMIGAGARGGVRGPFLILLNRPELADRVQQLGRYCRFECSLPERLRELAIVIVAAHWRADYEWHVHAALAARAGIEATALLAIGRGEAPDLATPADQAVHAFVRELVATGSVRDPAFNRAVAVLGADQVLDLTALVGYYTLLAMVINVGRVAVPDDSPIPWRDPP